MKIHHACDVLPDGRGLCCRQSRFSGVVVSLVIAGMLLAAPVFLWWHGAPWYFWGPAAGFAMLFLPFLTGELAARFRRTNWLLWLEPKGIWINLRSYQVGDETDLPTTVRLGYDEIATAAKRIETYTTPGSSAGRTVHWREQSLELRLNHSETDELRAALAGERARPGRTRTYFGGLSVTTRPTLFPISVPKDGTLRIVYRGGRGHSAAPSLSAVLAELERNGVAIAEPTRFDRPRWNVLSESEFDDQVRHLAESTSGFEAVGLLVSRRGLSTIDAREAVDDLVGKA